MPCPSSAAHPPASPSSPRRTRTLVACGLFAAGLSLFSACSAAPSSPAGGQDNSLAPADGHAGENGYAFGEPGQAGDSSQVIEITATDAQVFEPAVAGVPLGATVTFRVTNAGTLTHEFVLGDEPFQATHEAEMADMAHGHGTMDDEPYGFQLQPGETKDLVWHFTVPGEFSYACHTPGHYAVGMKGTISVQE